jgi:hypothetical protein
MPRCATCGKVLKNVLAIKIHVGLMHKKQGTAPKARRVVNPPAQLDVRSLAVDELIALKQQIDGRLAEVARRLRLAGVMGLKPGPKPGLKAKLALAASARRGVFKESATQMILRLLAGGKTVSTTDIAAAWTKAGRKGKPAKTLSDMVKAEKIKRQVLKGTRANNYTLA